MNKYRIITSVIIFAAVLASIFLVYTKPVEDGDLWWQMAYGKQLIEQGTLIPDHTIYTWTETDNKDIYCAWTSQISLFLTHRAFGMTGLYILRYMIPLFILFLIIFAARRLKLLSNPLTWLSALFFYLSAGSPVSFIKPEMFSFLFMTLSAFLWFIVKNKDSEERAGAQTGSLSSKMLVYLFPVLYLLWVNSHGGFIFGPPLMALFFIGDLINRRFSPDEALSDNTRKHLFIAGLISIGVLFITPYGYKYPLQLISSLGTQNIEELKTVSAYGATLDVATPLLYFIIQCFILVFLQASTSKRFRPDWGLVLANLFYAILYAQFLRTTYYWAPVFLFSVLWILKNEEIYEKLKRPIIKIIYMSVVLIIVLDMSRWAAYKYIVTPSTWLGFGNHYINTPEEAEYAAEHFKNLKIGNVYNNGGYLLWLMGPETKIMIDPRYFPFQNWYKKYIDFQTGINIKFFLETHNFDIFITQYHFSKQIIYFLTQPDWRLVYYSSGGPVFAKIGINLPEGITVGNGLYQITNLNQAQYAFNFCLVIGDWNSAKRILDKLKLNSRWNWEKSIITAMNYYIEGLMAYHSRDYYKAILQLEKCSDQSFTDNNVLQRTYNITAVTPWTEGKFKDALNLTEKALKANTDDPYSHFNIGVIRWWQSKQKREVSKMQINPASSIFGGEATGLTNLPDTAISESEKMRYEGHLKKFLSLTENIAGAGEPVRIARMILDGTYNKKPPLIHPPEPPLAGNK